MWLQTAEIWHSPALPQVLPGLAAATPPRAPTEPPWGHRELCQALTLLTSSSFQGQHNFPTPNTRAEETSQLPAGRKLWSRWSHLDVAVPKASRGHQDPTGQGWQDRASSRITPVWGIQIPDARCPIYGLINKWGIMPSLSNTFGCVMLSKSHYR